MSEREQDEVINDNAELCDSCDNEDCELKFSVKEKVFKCEDYLVLDDSNDDDDDDPDDDPE